MVAQADLLGGLGAVDGSRRGALPTPRQSPRTRPVTLIVCDTGGTTFDVGLVSDGEITSTAETWLGGRWVGHITGIRAVDVKSIGAGGGSIAWIDPGGLLRVGPRSAGADPGPACYGHGGSEPTVTDAAVCLGWIDPAFFLGGRLTLDPDAAREAIERAIAVPLGMTVHEAAYAALTIATENIVGAIREITIAQGIDPREMTLVAGGGASGLNIVPIARELGCRRVLLPSTASALSACGALYSDIISEFSRGRYAETRSLDSEAVNDALAEVEARADEFLAGLANISLTATSKEFMVEARYRAQVWELDVPVPARLESDDDVRGLEEAFHATHERIFAVREPGQYLECLLWKARATAVPEKPALRPRRSPEQPDGRSPRSRSRRTSARRVSRRSRATTAARFRPGCGSRVRRSSASRRRRSSSTRARRRHDHPARELPPRGRTRSSAARRRIGGGRRSRDELPRSGHPRRDRATASTRSSARWRTRCCARAARPCSTWRATSRAR